MSIHLLGIRHHGPGSTKSLLKALDQIEPDILLIEGPEELNPLIPYMEDEGLLPPVAALIYNPKNLQEAAYYPFTEFSPEWQAMKWALKQRVPIVNMDLPQSVRTRNLIKEDAAELSEEEKERLVIARDPLGYFARLAGYEDGETWWEACFEQGEGSTDAFEDILHMMRALRKELEGTEDINTLRREAYMRKVLRKAIKNGYERIAIICGAWHAPVLENYKSFKVKDDNALLKGLSKTKMKSTWIPWTYERISTQSGYGAGVQAPIWYEYLYKNREESLVQWMARVAQSYREENWEASSAHVIEAVRLAETLAQLRGRELPGVEELLDAVSSIFNEGDYERLELVKKDLLIGDRMGTVPNSIPVLPLQSAIDQAIKSLKLSKYKTSSKKWLKATAKKPMGGLDLRKDFDREQSKFLHRLQLLGITWGRCEHQTGKELSTKNEYWQLEWKADFALDIIEAGMWGNTVVAAANAYVQEKCLKPDSLIDLANLLSRVILADLEEAKDALIKELRNQAALSKDIQHLVAIFPSLVQVARYGDVRQSSMQAVLDFIDELLPRICISLLPAASALDEQASQKLFQDILNMHRALTLLDKEVHRSSWMNLLGQLLNGEQVSPLLRGAAARMLFDAEEMTEEVVGPYLSLALSKGNKVQDAALWLEGFLYGSGLILIHNPQFWTIIDQWVSGLKSSEFQELLPILRRSFAKYPQAEREKMLQLVKKGVVKEEYLFDNELDKGLVPIVLPNLIAILK